MGEDNRTLILILGIGLDPLHSFLLSQTTASSRSFPPLCLSLSLSLLLPYSPSRPLPRGSFPLNSLLNPSHQPAINLSSQMRPGPASSSTNLLSPSANRLGVQAALVQGPHGIKHMSSSSSIVRVFPPPFLGLSQYPVFTWRLTVAIIPTPHTSFSCPSQRGAIRSLTGLAFARIRLHTPRPVQTVHQSPTRCRSLDPICFPRLSDLVFSKFSLSPDPSAWGGDLSLNHAEADDYLHNPDPKRDRASDGGGHIFTARGLANLGCLATLAMAVITLLYALWLPVPRDAKTDHAPVPAIPSSLIFP